VATLQQVWATLLASQPAPNWLLKDSLPALPMLQGTQVCYYTKTDSESCFIKLQMLHFGVWLPTLITKSMP
jgi:hypothetical protein